MTYTSFIDSNPSLELNKIIKEEDHVVKLQYEFEGKVYGLSIKKDSPVTSEVINATLKFYEEYLKRYPIE